MANYDAVASNDLDFSRQRSAISIEVTQIDFAFYCRPFLSCNIGIILVHKMNGQYFFWHSGSKNVGEVAGQKLISCQIFQIPDIIEINKKKKHFVLRKKITQLPINHPIT